MPREDAPTKARRLLAEGRLTLQRVDPDTSLISAVCKGDSGHVYSLAFDGERWSCDCQAIGRCSHLIAAMLVTVTDPEPPR